MAIRANQPLLFKSCRRRIINITLPTPATNPQIAVIALTKKPVGLPVRNVAIEDITNVDTPAINAKVIIYLR